MDMNEKVISILKEAGKDLKAAEIAEIGGVEKKEVDKAIKKLSAEGKIHSPKRCYFNISR